MTQAQENWIKETEKGLYKMEIKRVSKSIWIINETRIDTRKNWNKLGIKYKGLRQALMLYFMRNGGGGVKWEAVDKAVCGFLNRQNSNAITALNDSYCFFK